MRSVSLRSHYDAGSDILVVWSRQPHEVLSTEPIEGIILRTDAMTDEFVGYTVLDCVNRFLGVSPDLASLPMVPEEWLSPLRDQLRSVRRSSDHLSGTSAPKRRPVRK